MNLKEKYPEQYLDHWIAMFSIHNSEVTQENCISQISFYKEMESEEEFKKLQEEIALIIKNNDLNLFLPILKDYCGNHLGNDYLNKMAAILIDNNKI